MNKKFTPKILIKYLVKEFSISLIIFFSIFLSLIVLTNFIEEIFFLREKKIDENLIFKTFTLSIMKTPTILINMSPFIFLFSGIFYYVKLLRSNEVMPLSLSGFSKNFVTLVPSFFSLFLGIMLITVITPISSELSKQYETIKQKYISNDNLIIMSDTGLWVKDRQDSNTFIVRADRIENDNFNNLSNIIIYKFENNGDLIERIEGDSAIIENEKWKIKNGKKLENNTNVNLGDFDYTTNINLGKLKNFFINPNTFSIWNINKELKQIRERGYFGQELVITYHKYLSLPFVLFSMVILATFFTLKVNLKFNNFVYTFFGVLFGILIYFLLDLSIAIGKSGKVPLIMSVWIPVISMLLISYYSLLKENE